MIELYIKKHLDQYLKVPVFLEHEEKMPNRFVIFEKTSGGFFNGIHSASVAVQSYAESMYEAANLNEVVKEAMFAMVQLPEIGSVKLNSDYNFTNAETKKYRYQAVFEMKYY